MPDPVLLMVSPNHSQKVSQCGLTHDQVHGTRKMPDRPVWKVTDGTRGFVRCADINGRDFRVSPSLNPEYRGNPKAKKKAGGSEKHWDQIQMFSDSPAYL